MLWGPPGTGKTTLALRGRRRSPAGGSSSCPRSPPGSRTSAPWWTKRAARTRHDGQADRAVHRRGAPVQQDPAGRAAARGGEPAGSPFIGATTENPFFSVVSPLLSRSLLLTLTPLSDDDIRDVIRRACTDERGLAGSVSLDDEALEHLVRLAGGDARRALTYLEAAALGVPAGRADRHRRPGARGGPRGRALRPRRRSALRRHQRVHQEHPGQRRRRRAALPGADDRGGGGPALHRPPDHRARQRGRRDGGPDGAAGWRSPRRRRWSSSGCPKRASTWPRP